MDLEATIREVRDRARENAPYITSLLRTRYVLIDPILRALGWDPADPGTVQVTTPGANRPIPNYILMDGGDIASIVWAMSVSPAALARLVQRRTALPAEFLPPEEEERKAEDYIQRARLNLDFSVITDGDHWRIYSLAKRHREEQTDRMENNLEAVVSILAGRPEEAASDLRRMERRPTG